MHPVLSEQIGIFRSKGVHTRRSVFFVMFPHILFKESFSADYCPKTPLLFPSTVECIHVTSWIDYLGSILAKKITQLRLYFFNQKNTSQRVIFNNESQLEYFKNGELDSNFLTPRRKMVTHFTADCPPWERRTCQVSRWVTVPVKQIYRLWNKFHGQHLPCTLATGTYTSFHNDYLRNFSENRTHQVQKCRARPKRILYWAPPF